MGPRPTGRSRPVNRRESARGPRRVRTVSAPRARHERWRTSWGAITLIGLMLLSGWTVLLAAPARAAPPAAGPRETVDHPVTSLAGPSAPSILGSLPRAVGVSPPSALCTGTPIPGCPDLSRSFLAEPRPAAGGPSSWLNLTPSPLPSAYPAPRSGGSMVWDAKDARVLLYGGGGVSTIYNDTWAYVGGHWRSLGDPSKCTNRTCPPARAYASMAYDVSDHEAVLFGGLTVGTSSYIDYGDTWAFSNGLWKNITASAGTAPSPRFDASMTWASSEGYVLLFGGENLQGSTLADTWSFVGGKWTNLTGSLLTAPYPAYGAAMADSPSGNVLMFGGAYNNTVIQDGFGSTSCGGPYVEWWFSGGQWTPADYPCVAAPHGSTSSNSAGVPCGRVGASLFWSPRNGHFVLFGGIGAAGCAYAAPTVRLNDTYEYLGADVATTFTNWVQDTSTPSPTGLQDDAYATDLADGYGVVLGGVTDSGYLGSDLWRYYAVVQAHFVGPSAVQYGALGFPIFTLTGFGGSGELDYTFSTFGLTTPNVLTGSPGCGNFTDGATRSIPSSGRSVGTVETTCQPDASAYNLFRTRVNVWDTQNLSAHAYANWTWTAAPPQSLLLYSQFQKVFFGGISFTNTFGVYAQIGNQPVSTVSGTYEGYPLSFHHDNGSNYWWNATFDMGTATSLGSVVQVVASDPDWSLNASMTVIVVDTPEWYQQLIGITGVLQSKTTSGTGPWNETYVLSTKIPLSIGKLFNFSIPIPFVGGNYSLVPDLILFFQETSAGNVTLSGEFTLAPPKVSFGVGDLTLKVGLNLTGTLALVGAKGTYAIDWVSATATIYIEGDVSIDIPIWGFKIDLGFWNGSIGFSVSISINPQVALTLFMQPSDEIGHDMLQGVDLMVTQLWGKLSLPLEVDATFGIVVASVSMGGKVSMDITFQIAPGQFEPNNLWINGSVVFKWQALIWSGSYNLLGPAVIYHWTPGFLDPARGAPRPGAASSSGLNPREYNTTGYDRLVWSPVQSQGSAITDIYPQSTVAVASASTGTVVFYSDDRVGVPVRDGLTVTGLALDAGTNAATTFPSPPDPGFEVTRPVSSSLPDGSVYVLWDALPLSETGGTSPGTVTDLGLHGARYYPENHSWGPVRVVTNGGVAGSFALDGSAGDPRATVLTDPVLFPSATTPERLVTVDLANGATLANASVSGLERVVSTRSGLGFAVVEDTPGNYSLRNLSSGTAEAIPFTAPAGWALVAAGFLPGSSSELLLRYLSRVGAHAVLLDLASGKAVATLPLSNDVQDVEGLCGGPTCAVLQSNASGLTGWDVAPDGSATPVPEVPAAGISTFGLAEDGGALVAVALVPSGGGSTGSQDLYLVELSSNLPALPSPAGTGAHGGPGGSRSSGGSTFDLPVYLGVPLLLAAAVLILLVLLRRRRGRSPTEPTPAPSGPPVPPPSAVSGEPPKG